MADENPNLVRSAWASPFYAAQRPIPSWERLNAPSSRVMVINTSEAQKHIVVDKFYVGHELAPGQRKEMELLDDEIAVFQEHRLPNRIGPDGMPKPLHAILIEGVPSIIEAQRTLREAKHVESARQKRLAELRELKELRDLEQEENNLNRKNRQS